MVQRRLPAPLWWSVVSGALLLVAFALYTIWAGVWTSTGVYLEDFTSYVATGHAVRAGQPLYEPGVSHLPTIGGTFKYTPFAAGVFVALTAIPQIALPMFAVLVNLFALLLVVWISLGQQGYARDQGRLAATAALTSVALAAQPVLLNMTAGQVNLVLLLLVLADLTGRGRWWTGAGVGIAAGIKLIPGIFVVYLLLTRRFRAAAVAVGAFALTVVAGFVAMPGDSRSFWAANLADPSRITGDNDAMSPENQSVRGALARLLGVADVPGAVWIPVAAVVAVAALWIAVRAHRQGRELLAVSVVGLVMVLVTPWTWTHYWVWFVPFFAMAAAGAWRSRRWLPVLALAAVYLLMFSWKVGVGRSGIPLVGLVLLPENFPPVAQALAHTLYVLLALLLLVLAALCPDWFNPECLGTRGHAPRTSSFGGTVESRVAEQGGARVVTFEAGRHRVSRKRSRAAEARQTGDPVPPGRAFPAGTDPAR